MAQYQAKTPAQIADFLKAHHQLVKVSFWIGAGASESAGIPTARSLVKEARERFPNLPGKAWTRKSPVSQYAHTIGRLAPLGKKLFLHETADKARKINDTHFYLAQLVAKGWVNQILTPNFDDLALRAMRGVLRKKPWSLDLCYEDQGQDEIIPPGGVIYLNGLAENNRVYSDPAKIQPLAAPLRRILARAAQDSVVIVLGYSGEKDPLFDFLANGPEFRHGLFWVTKDKKPAPHVSKNILKAKPDAVFFGEYDADRFMFEFAKEGMGMPERKSSDDGDGQLAGKKPAAPGRAKKAAAPKKKRAAAKKAASPKKSPAPASQGSTGALPDEADPGGEFIYSPAEEIDEDMVIKQAHEALVVGGSDALLGLAHQVLGSGAERTYPAVAEALLDWGTEILNENKLDMANAAFEAVTQLEPQNPDGYVGMANVAEKKGDRQLASQLTQKAFALGRE